MRSQVEASEKSSVKKIWDSGRAQGFPGGTIGPAPRVAGSEKPVGLAAIEGFKEAGAAPGAKATTGLPDLDEAFDGLMPRVYLVAAGPNVGKTAFCSLLASAIPLLNEDFGTVYFTLDDPDMVVFERMFANSGLTPLKCFSRRSKYRSLDPNYEEIDSAEEMCHKRIVIDRTQDPMINGIEEDVSIALLEADSCGLHIAIFIDNLYDVMANIRSDSANDLIKHVSERVKQMSAVWKLPIICTAEIRKTEGMRRPTMGDVKDSIKTAFKADAILGLYSEVGVKKDRARIFWTKKMDTKLPILEVDFVKNKSSGFKQKVFFRFEPSKCLFWSCSKEETDRFRLMAYN